VAAQAAPLGSASVVVFLFVVVVVLAGFVVVASDVPEKKRGNFCERYGFVELFSVVN
jgi:hypothetical protein